MNNLAGLQYVLPPGTVNQLTEDAIEQCQNLGLLLDRYVPAAVLGDNEKKNPWLNNITKSNHVQSELARAAYLRWERLTRTLATVHFKATTDWRMVVGLGGETVLETDLTLHHLYGIPYIPASALKGLTRSYATGEVDGYKSEKIGREYKDQENILRIFGSQEQAGTVIFFDAFPLNGEVKFALDIMNPHYPNYYRDRSTPPTNDQKPSPITFLTVAATTFAFALAPRRSSSKLDRDDVNLVSTWLQAALANYGVGGKTSAGYGYFNVQAPYARPDKLPYYKVGDTVRGTVVDENIDPVAAKYIQSGRASKCLQLIPFPTNQVLILIDSQYPEARQWRVRNVSLCQLIEEREEDNRTLFICSPKKK